MKKLLFLIMTALIVVGCSKSDEEKSDIQEIWLNGYKALTPESDYENISTTFLLFKADNNEEFDVKKQTFSGNILDYQKIQDETWNLLSKSKIKRDYPSDCVNRKLREKSCSFFYLYINFVKRIFYGHSQRIFK